MSTQRGSLNLDTHIVLFLLTDQLRPHELDLLRREPWSVSAIVLWELAKLQQLKRVEIDLPADEWDRFFNRIHIWPLSPEVCRASTTLDIRSDPADELIAATSLVHQIPLLTRDAKLLASKIVPLAT